jgi:predicted peptidase
MSCAWNASGAERPTRKEIELNYSDKKANLTYILPNGYDKTKKYPLVLALPWGKGGASEVGGILSTYWENEGYKRGYIIVSPALLGPTLEKDGAAFGAALFKFLDTEVSYDKDKVYLAGSSNGGYGLFFLILAMPERFRAAIAMPGFLKTNQGIEKLKGKSFWIIAGEKEAAVGIKGASDTHKSLEKSGAKSQLNMLKDQGHVLKINPKELFDWFDKN